PVLLLTSKSSEIDEVVGLHSGADDYLRKPVSPHVLIERIRACLRRAGVSEIREPGARKTIRNGPIVVDEYRHEVSWKGVPIMLTVTEFRLLFALVERPGFVRSRQQLQDIIYGPEVFVEDRCIDSHVKRLRKKLRQADAGFDAIEAIYGVGYRFNLPEEKRAIAA
ncbi:winged helix-turn-helix domain-containing protein, partial [Cribrihabitans sp. XS_ASV171]